MQTISNGADSKDVGQTVVFSEWEDVGKNEAPFKDNYDHLEALEVEAKTQLAFAYYGRTGCKTKRNGFPKEIFTEDAVHDSSKEFGSFEHFKARLDQVRKSNRQRERITRTAGVELLFENVCRSYELDAVERQIVLLIFMKESVQGFRDLYARYGFNSLKDEAAGLTAETLLGLLSPDFKDQMKNRKYFSIESKLIEHEIIVGHNHGYRDAASIFKEEFLLHQRITGFIIGDNNVYDSDLKCIKRISVGIDIDKLILPEEVKRDILFQARNHVRSSQNRNAGRLKDFFGYGTGLTFLFHGPSGTGKTMMAYALASELGQEILSVDFGKSSQYGVSEDTLIENVFREAKLSGSIVFFDECDDVFQKDSYNSMVLLTEIEKAECITILATNKVVKLDPAMDRRINMKVPFRIPAEEERERLWEVLTPPFVEFESDVDRGVLARKYLFTGGIIKNSVLMAINEAGSDGGGDRIRLSKRDIEASADRQAEHLFHTGEFGKVYKPSVDVGALPLSPGDTATLENLSVCTKRIDSEETGCFMLLTAGNVAAGIEAAEGIASASGLRVRRFVIEEVFAGPKEEELINPLTHAEMDPLDYVFGVFTGHRSMTLIVDHHGMLEKFLSEKDAHDAEFFGFFNRIRSTSGIVYYTCPTMKNCELPPEVTKIVQLGYPTKEMQIGRWSVHFQGFSRKEDRLAEIVDKYPLHIRDIDHFARLAKWSAIIEDGDDSRAVSHIEKAIGQNRMSTPVLFGSKT
ncbi:MAG: ATP-binding protein [Proteobacteria bacterium]|nr:ATP-binding protein [Pseudomonadota bacterium]